MGRSRDSKRNTAPRIVPGLWASLLERRREAVTRIDARLPHGFMGGRELTPDELAARDEPRRQRAEAVIASMEAGERQWVAARDLRAPAFREAVARVGWLTLHPSDPDAAATVWVYPDDTVELRTTQADETRERKERDRERVTRLVCGPDMV